MNDENVFHEMLKAINRGDTMLLKRFLACGISAALTDGNGRTLLHEACVSGNNPAITVLLRYGCPKDVKDAWGNTASSEAIRSGFGGIATKIDSWDADPLPDPGLFVRSLSGFEMDPHMPIPAKPISGALGQAAHSSLLPLARRPSGALFPESDDDFPSSIPVDTGSATPERGPDEILLTLQQTPGEDIPEGEGEQESGANDAMQILGQTSAGKPDGVSELSELIVLHEMQKKRVEELVGEPLFEDEAYEEEELPSGEIEEMDMELDMGLGRRWREEEENPM